MDINRDTSGSTGALSSVGSTSGGMHHSLSTPAGVDGGARTPPATPKKGGKMLAIRVQMLDDTITIFQVQAKALGRVLFEQVCKQLHLLEADYFGLEYQDLAGTRYWLDLQKPISRQLGLSLVDPLLYFCVKFYTPDPAQLEEEYTRYLFCLQVKRDLAQGYMQCNDNTAALMASYIVQAECGDYVSEDYPDHTYLSSYKFVPHQDHDMERRIMENHKKHAGQSPAEADLNLLETARRCELYGVKMHSAKDHENVTLNLAVAHMGIVVFQHYTKINTFSWAKIRKISFKRKRFLIKLHPEGYGYYKDTVEFFFEGRNECKNFWKKCVENHGFFRCTAVKSVSRHKTRVLSRGSSFRYSGKTQKQIVEFVRDNYVKRQTFQRSASFRHSSAHSSANNMQTSTVGNSISAHPLLPLADSNLSVEASKLSASLGSMDPAVGAPGSPTTRLASRHHVTATSWSSAPDTRPTTLRAQMMNSPSPPLTTQSATPVTSATTSPQHILYEDQPTQPYTSNSPVAVHAAVHRADTGINIRTHTTSTRTPSSHKSEGAFDHNTPNLTNNCPTQTQSQNDIDMAPNSQASPEYTYKSITTLPKRHVWQRSASCRELYDFSFEDSGQAKRRVKAAKHTEPHTRFEERKLESPITRYDDHSVIYNSDSRNASLELHQDIMMPDQKVYSSSYPGTTSYSQESMEDPGNYDLRDSQDDLSHDSYELIERSDDDYSTSGDSKGKKMKNQNTRSCSLDSGNYLPSDSESESDKRHKCKSSSDVHQDIFMMEDPRDLPREIIPRKSDGSFYKAFKSSSRTSSQESKSDYYESKTSKSSRESLKKKDQSLSSRTSSQESKSDYETKRIARNKSYENMKKHQYIDSRASSLDSKSEYYDTTSKVEENKKYHHDYDRKIQFQRNYGTQKPRYNNSDTSNFQNYSSFPTFKETSHVHSISLQNVKTEQNIRSNRMLANLEQNTVPRTQKPSHKTEPTHFESPRYYNKPTYDHSVNQYESQHYKNEPSHYKNEPSHYKNEATHYKVESPTYMVDSPHYKDESLHYNVESHYKVESPHYKVESPHYKVESPHYKVESPHYKVESPHYKVESPHYKVESPHYKVGSPHYTVESPHYKVESPCYKNESPHYKSDQVTHIWPESIAGVQTEIRDWKSKPSRSSESENNIFSFDEDKIQSLQEGEADIGFSVVPDIDVPQKSKKDPFKDVFIEIEPRRLDKEHGFHQPIERTKSDPNSLARQRLNSNSRRLPLIHQKTIDLTPAESSDEDYLYKQIPSAPPIMKYRDTHFEMPSAEFGHFDVLKREVSGQKTKFEVPRRQFEILGVKAQSDFINLPPKTIETDIPYVLHKRHIMNGTAHKDKINENEWDNEKLKECGRFKEKHDILNENDLNNRDKINDNWNENEKWKESEKRKDIERRRDSDKRKDADRWKETDNKSKDTTKEKEIKKPSKDVDKSRDKFDKSRDKALETSQLTDLNKLNEFDDFKDYKYEKYGDVSYENLFDTNETMKERNKNLDSPRTRKIDKSEFSQTFDESKLKKKRSADPDTPEPSTFLFTQNIDLSKIDPVTLEIDKSIPPIQHMSSPKRDITRIDPIMLEALNNKLSQIESDSPTSSKTESLKPIQKLIPKEEVKIKVDQATQKCESKCKAVDNKHKPQNQKVKEKPKSELKKRVIKPRMQPNKKGAKNKTKVRITSFSSDDESIDSDDVFGSAEATPTKCEFSPPQSRKEMEPILKIESERKYLQYTMSSTEVEGSPPQTRKVDTLRDRSPDPNFQTELRRISERSFSIPSSEDDFNIQTADLQPVFGETDLSTLKEDREDVDKSVDDTIEQVTVQELLKEDDLKLIEAQKEKEKELLRADIENDLKDLRVPSRTKLTEVCSPSSRRKGQSPLLFAHARLNLSEGSAFSLLQKQQAMESPVAGRRAKSLDAPVIPVSRLPPLNAFSSKDDTVEEEDHVSFLVSEFSDVNEERCSGSDFDRRDLDSRSRPERREEDINLLKTPGAGDISSTPDLLIGKNQDMCKKVDLLDTGTPKSASSQQKSNLEQKSNEANRSIKPEAKSSKIKVSDRDKDQIVPDVIKTKRTNKTISSSKPSKGAIAKGKPPTPKTGKPPTPKEKPCVKTNAERKPTTSNLGNIKGKTSSPSSPAKPKILKTDEKHLIQKSHSADRMERAVESDREENRFASQNSLTLPEIKRTKSQELESVPKRPTDKEKAKSLEKLEFRRASSKERSKSQEESDTDIAKRKEKQQMLYEIAMQQTKTLKSPVKDVLPVFPQVEEMVRERGGKLEISINTIEPNVSLEEAIIITKSPKRLDKKMDKKFTKSLELNLTLDHDDTRSFQRLGNSLDLDNRPEKESQQLEFDFELETINSINYKDVENTSKNEENKEDIEIRQQFMEDSDNRSEAKLADNKILPKNAPVSVSQKSFFEHKRSVKPPDLSKIETKSSSDSQSMEKLSLGNSLDIKYIDSSGDSSHKSEKDAQLIAELQKASKTIENRLLRKTLKKPKELSPDELPEDKTIVRVMSEDDTLIADTFDKEIEESTVIDSAPIKSDIDNTKVGMAVGELKILSEDNAIVRVTSEDESLTEVSELRCESHAHDNNLLGVCDDHKDALLKLSIERSRSEDTGSWITVDCEEHVGEESFDYDNQTSFDEKSPIKKDSDVEFKIEEQDSPKNEFGPKKELVEEIRIQENFANDDVEVDELRNEEDNKLGSEEKIDSNFLSTDGKYSKFDILKRSSDQSRSSDTTGSWTSGEKDLSPSNTKENEESSVSCSIGRAIGLSQTIEMFATRDQLDKTSPDIDGPKSPRSPRSPRICVLGRAFTIDEDSSFFNKQEEKTDESSSSGTNDFPKDLTPIQENESTDEGIDNGVKYKKKPYPFEEKWSNDSELTQRLNQKLSSKKISGERNSLSSMDDSQSDRRRKSPLNSVERLSTESKNSIDTESSSGSLGIAARLQRTGEILKEPGSTWRPFPLESSGSSSLEEGVLPTDQDFYGQEYFLSRENSGEFAALSDITYQQKDDDVTPTADCPGPFNYPPLPAIAGSSSSDSGTVYNPSFFSRTLSRISERSTNSEKSSIDEDSTKASSHTESNKEESIGTSGDRGTSSGSPSNAHVSDSEKKTHELKSEKRRNTEKSRNSDIQVCESLPNIVCCNLLQRQISDDRRTSAEMAELSMDDIEIITSERGLRLRRQESEDTIIDEECFESDTRDKKGSSSQDSDEWPLPDIPQHAQGQKSLIALHEMPSTDTSQLTTQVYQPVTQMNQPVTPQSAHHTMYGNEPVQVQPLGNQYSMHGTQHGQYSQASQNYYSQPHHSQLSFPYDSQSNTTIPKVFGLRGSLKSQDSEQWPSPPSSVAEHITGSVETFYMTPPEEACKVIVDSSAKSSYENDSNSDNENKTLDFDKSHTYENVAISEQISESLSESLSAGPSGVKIVLQTKSAGSGDSEEDLNISNDDVFTDSVDNTLRNELRPPTVLRRSTASDDSSHSGHKQELRPPSRKSSHSSYSEEECTSSLGTTLEDGTVRYALKPTKCTHSSHSEDTSIALSLSEWSNSTNTVKFQNLSSNSGTTKSSSGLKSDDNSLTDIAQSISEWSSSNSNTLKAQSLQFQKLSSTTSTGDSTLTLPTEWSSSEKSLVTQQFYPGSALISDRSSKVDRQSISRLGSSFEEADVSFGQDTLRIASPTNIPSEDLAFATALADTELIDSILYREENYAKEKYGKEPGNKYFKEGSHFMKENLNKNQYGKDFPIIKPPVLSDTEKSTESSSMEQRTVQRYDRDKFKYNPKHLPSSKSTERPIKVPLKLAKCSPYYSSSLSSESTPLHTVSPIPMSKTATIPLTRAHRKPVAKHLFQAKSPPSENDSTSSMESPRSRSESRDRRGYRKRRQVAQKRHKVEKGVHTQDDYFYYQEREVCDYNEYIRNKSMEEVACAFRYETVLSEAGLSEGAVCSRSGTSCTNTVLSNTSTSNVGRNGTVNVALTSANLTSAGLNRSSIETYSEGEYGSKSYSERLEEGYIPDGDSQSGSDIFRMEREEDDRYEVVEGFDVSCIPPPLLEDDFENDRQI